MRTFEELKNAELDAATTAAGNGDIFLMSQHMDQVRKWDRIDMDAVGRRMFGRSGAHRAED